MVGLYANHCIATIIYPNWDIMPLSEVSALNDTNTKVMIIPPKLLSLKSIFKFSDCKT
jgi:hypothetical protein